MLALIWTLLSVLSGVSLYLFSQRETRVVKGWHAGGSSGKNGTEITLTTPDTIQQGATFLSIALKYVPFTAGYRTRLVVNASGDGFDLPLIKLHGPVVVTEEEIDTFNLAVSRRFIRKKKKENEKEKEEVALNPLFFVSFCTPLILHVLADHRCPIRPLGSVNTANRFVFGDAAFCRDRKAILQASHDRLLSYTCSFGGSESQGHRRKRGVEFDITIIVKKGETVVLEVQSSFMQFLSARHPPAFKQIDQQQQIRSDRGEQQQQQQQGEASTPIFMGLRHPHRWAAACSDYNPIHINRLAARLFGFSSVIAHGNHAVALAVQDALEEGVDAKMVSKSQARSLLSAEHFSLEVRFVKPVLLPTDLNVSWVSKKVAAQGGGVSLEMRVKDRVSITGELKG